MVAAHPFPWQSGQDAMAAIFGEDANNELFSSRNGLLISGTAKMFLDNGTVALGPAIDYDISSAQIELWNALPVKQYRLRISRPNDECMDEMVSSDSNITWKEMDNKPVTFRSHYCPRASYLCYVYFVAPLCLAYNMEKNRWHLEIRLVRSIREQKEST